MDETDLIGLAKGFGPDLLKVAPAALKAAPAALPLLATALTVPGELLFVGAAGSFAAGENRLDGLSDTSRILLCIDIDIAATAVGYCVFSAAAVRYTANAPCLWAPRTRFPPVRR